jgi:uncharacterized membrane protein
MSRRPHLFTILVLVGAALGLLFASVSTADFARHLDREVHSVSCSFTPGLSEAEAGQSDCKTTMFSAYSSVMRGSVWGGVPISLPAMSVFAFLLLLAIELTLTRRQEDARAASFLALATMVPAVTSTVMAFISFSELGAACKMCIGIYVASALVVVGGVGLRRRAVRLERSGELEALEARVSQHGRDRATAVGYATAAEPAPPIAEGGDPAWASGPAQAPRADPMADTMLAPELAEIPKRPAGTVAQVRRARLPVTWGYLVAASALGVAFVLIPVFAYATLAPDHSRYIGTCGSLVEDKDTYQVMVPLGGSRGGVKTIEVLDPLCPACRAFEDRLEASGLGDELDRTAILFPLDSECNWMVDDRVHAGACAISEAVLCAGDRAAAVVEWAFAEQDQIRAAAASSGDAARAMARARFPELARCVGSAAVKQRLNKSLRWAVTNKLAVLTPQIFVDGVKLCDEDTDLGLEYQLRRMLDRARAGTLKKGAAR